MMETKRQVLPQGLWVVATPIGNLGDFTERAKFALTQADLILCEDTRRTAVLLSALGISLKNKKLERCDAHTPVQAMDPWIECLKEGKNLALVTDAGTPGVSDPGAVFVHKAQQEGVQVTPLPGVSAVMTLLSVSGFQDTSFTFRGFFPRKIEEQKGELRLAAESQVSRVFVWFESPQRILDAMELLQSELSEGRVIVGKELTKLHENFFWGTPQQVAEQVREEIEREGKLGEWAFAVEFPRVKGALSAEKEKGQKDVDFLNTLRCLLDAGVSASEAAKRVGQYFDRPRREIYEAALQLSGKKTSKGG